MEETRNKRKIVLTVVLVLALIAAAITGTYAWLTAQDSAQNTFTVGEFNEPSVKPDPSNPDEPSADDPSTDGFLTETKWVDLSKVYQGAEIAKNPNVGIGEGSDDAYVFVYVDNNTQASDEDIAANAPYFSLNEDWEAVEADSITVGEGQTAYTGGLFVYKGGEPNSHIFKASENADDYTGEVFSQVIVPERADLDKYAEKPTMDVFAYLYSVQYIDAAQSTPATSGEGSYAAAVEAAKLWDNTWASS